MSSDKIEAGVPCAVQLDPTTEQLHRLRKWAFNPRNDKDPLALAVRVLFEDRDKAWRSANNQVARMLDLEVQVRILSGHLRQYRKRHGDNE